MLSTGLSQLADLNRIMDVSARGLNSPTDDVHAVLLYGTGFNKHRGSAVASSVCRKFIMAWEFIIVCLMEIRFRIPTGAGYRVQYHIFRALCWNSLTRSRGGHGNNEMHCVI